MVVPSLDEGAPGPEKNCVRPANRGFAEQFGTMPLRPTIRLLAEELRLSISTVSDALKGTGRVGETTVRRVRDAARRMNYRVNPLTAAMMADIRRSRADTFRGVLAVVEINEPERAPHGPFPRQIVAGAHERAAELGFEIAEFLLGKGGLTPQRLDSVLQSRGIRGILLLPAWNLPRLAGLDWSRYAAVYTDSLIEEPALHRVCPDHYRSMMQLLQLLYDRGYRRPGLVLDRGRDERIQLRRSAAFCAFLGSRPDVRPVPVSFVDEYRFEHFRPWFRRHRPDVVLSHDENILDWMERLGVTVPEKAGFALLNTLGQRRRCAGLELQPKQLGARAVELLVGQLFQNQVGLPTWPTSTMLDARWVEGPTVRMA